MAEPTETGDDLVEDQQDAVARAEFAQPLEIADRRNENTGRSRDRLNDDGSNRRCIVGRDHLLKRIGQLCPVRRLTAAEGVLRRIMRVRQMHRAGQEHAELLLVRAHARSRQAAETDAVITALTPDDALALPFTPRMMVGKRDLERGIGGFRAGIGEEHAVHAFWRNRR